jgi:hypothetical protein
VFFSGGFKFFLHPFPLDHPLVDDVFDDLSITGGGREGMRVVFFRGKDSGNKSFLVLEQIIKKLTPMRRYAYFLK